MLDIILVSLLASSGSQTTPTLPGGIIAWIVCNGRKRNPIGGWLLFYYWQLYSTFVLSAVFFGTNIQSYVPENFEDKARFAVFLITVVPGLLLLFTQVCVATFSLGVQTPDMLKLLRGILIAQALASVLEVVLGAQFFPNTEFLPILMLIQEGLWLAYFFRSSRVRHVFSLQDWETAVNLIYPAKLDLST